MLRPTLSLASRTLLPNLSRSLRPFSTTAIRMAGGDTGSMRSGGDRHADTWSRREKAMEDMYIREREKEIMIMLKEKIALQIKQLDKDRLILNQMEENYGEGAEEEWSRKY